MDKNFYAEKLSQMIGDRNHVELSKLSGLSRPTISALKNRKSPYFFPVSPYFFPVSLNL